MENTRCTTTDASNNKIPT